MGLLIRIAWRNLWRNPRRSAILLSAIVVCIFALLLTLSYINGILRQMVESTIEFHLGEMEIYQRGFIDDHNPARHMRNTTDLMKMLEDAEGVRAYAPRVEGRGLVSSGYASSGVKLVGIDPEKERGVTLIKRSVVDGDYLTAGSDHAILIGEQMARKLNVGLGDKVVITVQTVGDELASDAFRVAGIFRTISRDFDRYMVYVPIKRADQLLEMKGGITGIALRMNDMTASAGLQREINENFAHRGMAAYTWGELEPMVREIVEISKQWNFVFFGAIFIILSIGIINTQNIAVYERMHELGIIKAMGTRPRFIFFMVMAETFFLGLLGMLAGLLISYPVIFYFSIEGLNLTHFSEGLQQFGIGATIFFHLELSDIVWCTVAILLTAFVGAFFPAVKAGRLEPVRAIRHQ